VSGPLLMPDWDSLATRAPQVADTMRRYLAQIECVLRPGSVRNTAQALRAYAAFLVQAYPQLQTSPRSTDWRPQVAIPDWSVMCTARKSGGIWGHGHAELGPAVVFGSDKDTRRPIGPVTSCRSRSAFDHVDGQAAP
jgi:hypothetical protein